MPDDTKVVEEIGVIDAELAAYKDLNVIMDAAHRVYVDNYNDIRNKPTINGVEVKGNKAGGDYNLLNSADELTEDEIHNLASKVWSE